ncbi:MAG: ribosome-associated translation inhibitor RaiA [Clostridiales bacterium]|jgi:putative sigma-54 modulation protein|nr:ribosome-associated translation inhibitor RaiA [Clostridiales bacterium]
MRYTFTVKNGDVSDTTKMKIGQKIGRIERLFSETAEAFVTISSVKNNHTVEVTIPLNKRILRAEVTTDDLFASLDDAVDILERQMVRYKGRLRDRSVKDIKFKEEFSAYSDDDVAGDEGPKIEKTKRFALKPMDAEEAVMEMEMLNHSFYVFRNGDTDDINVVYKRKDDSYGLIEPEY